VQASLAAWTKNEGLLFVAGVVGLTVWRLLARRVRDWHPWTVLLVPPFLAVVPWMAVRRFYAVPASGLIEAAGWKWANLGPAMESIITQAARPGTYNLAFWLLVASLLAARRVGLDSRWWVLPGLVFWQLGGLVAAYLRVHGDLRLFIGTSLDRVLAQLAPLALLAATLAAGAWLQAAAASQDSSRLTQRRSYRNLKTKPP
jgi:hypothetical protein